MEDNCCICMELVFLPVEIICFSCFKNNEINCSSFSRICLTCAHSFLQLDIDVDKRDFYKKCLFCPSLVYLHKINHSIAYKKDFCKMIVDTKNYSCPFCHNYQGTQIMINHHIEKECNQFYTHCLCNKLFKKQDYYFHLLSCEKHIFCPICLEYIPKDQINNHRKEEHNQVYCNLCKTYVNWTFFDHHIEHECPDRLTYCSFCMKLVSHRKMESHLYQHKDDIVTELQEVNEKYSKILDKFNLLQELLKPFQNLLQ